MWTAAARAIYRTDPRFYPSSMSDDEWKIIKPFLPPDEPPPIVAGLKRGRDAKWPMRTVLDAIFYVLRNGVPWRSLPKDFPPWKTVYHWFRRFAREALFERINHDLVMRERERAGREASPTGAVIDSQTVKATEAPAPRDYDGGKKIVGLKRHALVDTDGNLLMLIYSLANLHDSVAGAALLAASRREWPFIAHVWADAGYRGPGMALAVPGVDVEIVTGPKNQKGFIVQKRRWVVERSFAWFGRSRRLWRVCEAVVETISAMTYAASVFTLMRRIAKEAAC